MITQRVGEAAKIDLEMGVEYRRHLFEKTGLGRTADGSDDKLINLEGVWRGKFSFIDADSAPESMEDLLAHRSRWRIYCRPRLLLPTRNTRRAQATRKMSRTKKGARATEARITN